jgi:hypothetical protein
MVGTLVTMTPFLHGQSGSSGYAAPEACASCHRDLWETYRKTGMARSFYRPEPANMVEGTYFHQPSDSTFSMIRRDGEYLQRRHQIDFAGKIVNVMEKQVDFIMG